MVRKLPTVDGYTVDERLREFRKMEFGKEAEFIPFDSERGKPLMKKYECCKDFCAKLDYFIEDEQKATQEYKDMADTAREHGEDKTGIIFDTLSTDENKHFTALKKLAILVCGKEF